MKKLLIISMLSLGLLAQANEQERELHESTQVDTQAELMATDTAVQVETKDENSTSETVESAAAELRPHPKKNKSNKTSSSSLASQYLAGFVLGSATGAVCRVAGGKDNKHGVLAWIGEWLFRDCAWHNVKLDMQKHERTELAEGTYVSAQLGSWVGYLATHHFLSNQKNSSIKRKI